MRKFLTVLLSLMMVVTMMPVMTSVAFAASGTSEQDAWQIGKTTPSDIKAWLDNGMLHIKGTGEMRDITVNQYWRKSEKRNLITTVNIESGITSIAKDAFNSCSKLTAITIPESVTSIGNKAFYNCSSLTAITIPESVTTIGEDAFRQCTSLANITIPEGVTEIGQCAFRECTSLTNITIPKGVKSIATSTFLGCTSLANITIPEGVTKISETAFYGCKNLAAVRCLATTPTNLAENAFEDCAENLTIYVPAESVEDYTNDENWKTAGEIVGASFVGDYMVIINNEDKNGTVKANVTSGIDLVTLTVTPNNGYKLGTLTVEQKTSPSNLIPTTPTNLVGATKVEFEMPDDDVTVTAEFEEVHNTSPSNLNPLLIAAGVTATTAAVITTGVAVGKVVKKAVDAKKAKAEAEKEQIPQEPTVKEEPTPTEPTTPTLTADQVKEAVEGLAIRCNTKKTADGTEVYTTVTDGDIEALEAAGYTVTYKFYRSKYAKKSYKLMETTANANYTDTTGVEGTMYYYKAKVVVTDKDGNEVAVSAIKDCKYGNRKF